VNPGDPIKDYLAAIGRRGGSVKSAAKARAAKKNGEKGGRPRKIKDEKSS
jgi:hypothetical protein